MKYKMTHTCIRVLNLEKSIEFYKNALGLHETRRKDVPENKFTLVFMSDESENHEIELTYNYDQQSPYNIGNGFSHTAFYVDDLEKSHENHKNAGYKVTDIYGVTGNKSIYFLEDPDGYKVEILRSK